MDKGIMVADSFRSEQECCAELALVWKYAKEGKGNYYEVDGYLFRRDKILGESIGQLVIRSAEELRSIDPPSLKGHKYILRLVDQPTRWGEALPLTSLSAKELSLEQSSRLLTVAIIVCSVCGFSVSRFVNFLFLVSDMVKSATRGILLLGGACKEQLPAPGNRSNERRYREKDLATTEEKRSEREIRERVTKKAGVVKVDTAERCIVIL
ncbi:integrase_H2C2 domain-containing protein [Trichonephila clavipes]|uniref:Integrase_H2C2 domain-containing protein n=1 Tax=Trichonephila clavipes TaxID=2585209 RepID=A0A8X6RIS8_TRICX|nr:integrase_H2C2 domain-containing protein [Trichonephila clavipes]